MKANRHVPWIIGIFCTGAALWLIFAVSGWFKMLFATPLMIFGWFSLKMAIFAKDHELAELTGEGPVSPQTSRRIEDLM